jgi:hypothetical protein
MILFLAVLVALLAVFGDARTPLEGDYVSIQLPSSEIYWGNIHRSETAWFAWIVQQKWRRMSHYIITIIVHLIILSCQKAQEIAHAKYVLGQTQSNRWTGWHHNPVLSDLHFYIHPCNPTFTASVLLAYARAAYRMNKEGNVGAKTVFDIPASYLSPWSADELRREML